MKSELTHYIQGEDFIFCEQSDQLLRSLLFEQSTFSRHTNEQVREINTRLMKGIHLAHFSWIRHFSIGPFALCGTKAYRCS